MSAAWRTVVATLAVALLGAGATGSAQASGSGFNSYWVRGLPEYTTTATAFTVEVTGDIPVCQMAFRSQLRTGAPWTFTYDPVLDASGGLVLVSTCDGEVQRVGLPTQPAWTVDARVVPVQAAEAVIAVDAQILEAADAAVTTSTGTVLARASVPSGGVKSIRFPVPASTAATSAFTLRLTTRSGVTMSIPIAVSRRWGALTDGSPTFQRCSKVTWLYDPTGAPKTATSRAIRADIVGALTRMSAATGLVFVEAPSRAQLPASNRLVFDWKLDRKESGAAAAVGGYILDEMGRVLGEVNLNATHWWTRSDAYRGFSLIRSGRVSPGRGWLFVHELGHVLGLDHVPQRSQLMYPRISTQMKFGDGDLAGLDFLYQPASCRR